MKVKALIMGLGVITLASCSSEDPIEVNQGRAIGFRPALSRSTEITNSNLQSLNVSAFMDQEELFGNQTFNKGDQGIYTSSPEYYWPGDDSPLNFYAYAPITPGGKISITSSSKTLTDFSPAQSLADQIDFITSTASGKKSENEANGVELTFNHRLSQIEIQAKTDNDAYTFEVTGIRIGQPVSIGSFDFDTNKWTLGTDRTIYEDTYTNAIVLNSTPQSVMGNGGNALLIPQTLTAWDPSGDGTNTASGAYLSLKLKISTKETGADVYPFPSNTQDQWAAIPIAQDWEAGRKYVYVLDLTHGAGYVDPNDPNPGQPVLGGAIKFTVNVVDWNQSADEVDLKAN